MELAREKPILDVSGLPTVVFGARIAALNILFRVFGFASLNAQWYANAYASTVWVLLGVHSGHLATEFIDTAVLSALAFTDRVEGTRFANFDENSDYWFFVVMVALIADVVIYGASRWL